MLPAALAVITLLLHVISNLFFAYGYFRDEFYYLVCGDHLAFGYVDHPPLIAVIARGTRTLLGDSLVAIRLPSALAHAGLVLLTGLMARMLGGRRFAQALACAVVMLAPVYLVAGNMLSTVPFDELCWALVAFFLLRLLTTDDPRYWLAVGAAVGIGLETKHNMAFLAVGIAAGVLLTANRRYLRSRWLWYGAAVAVALALPHLVWQAVNGWPTWDFTRNAADKNAHISPIGYIAQQILAIGPLACPVWITGLIWYLRTPRYRLMASCYLVPLLVLMATQSARADYLAPAYPPLIAAGAVVIARAAERHAWLRPAALAPVLLGGLLLLPIGLPILSPARLSTLESRLTHAGVNDPSKEKGKTAQLPQYFADQFGWQELTATITEIYDQLSPSDRARAAIFTSNYGEAGALAFFGGEHLPPIISGHNNYYLWGPGRVSGDEMIVVGYDDPSDLRQFFGDVQQVGTTHCTYCMDYENNVPVWLARDPRQPIATLWPRVKHYT
jgi:hypothetical protein